MNILQCGFPKSGNFWLYKIIQQVLQRAGYSTKSFIEQQPIYSIAKDWKLNFPEQSKIDVLDITDLQFSYRISSIFRMPLDDIKDYASKTPHVWTHSPICKRSHEVFDVFSKKVCIIRDPRDMIISASRYYCSDYMLKYFPQEEKNPQDFLLKNFDKLMLEWLWHVFDFLQLSRNYNIHITFFENFLSDFQQELQKLLEYLGIFLDQDQKEALEQEVSFKNLKQKNPDHLVKGKSAYWMNQLSDEQISKADAISGPLIKALGYPVERFESINILKDFHNMDLEGLKEKLLQIS